MRHGATYEANLSRKVWKNLKKGRLLPIRTAEFSDEAGLISTCKLLNILLLICLSEPGLNGA